MATEETRRRLLEAAERLFAKKGFNATTLRELTREASTNLAAVNYHFGSKEGLLVQVLDRGLRPINEERMELLRRARETYGDSPIPVRVLLHAFFAPAVRLLTSEHPGLPNILLRLNLEPHPEAQARVVEWLRPVAEAFADALHESLPHLDRSQIMTRGVFMTGAFLYMLDQGRELLPALNGHDDAEDPGRLLDELVACCESAFLHAA